MGGRTSAAYKGKAVVEFMKEVCGASGDDLLFNAVVKCLEKGAVQVAYILLSIDSSVKMLLPDDEPPLSMCIVDSRELGESIEVLQFIHQVGIPSPGEIRVIAPKEEGGEQPSTHLTPSCFAVFMKGRRTGMLYTYIFAYSEGEWRSIPVFHPYSEVFVKLFNEKCVERDAS